MITSDVITRTILVEKNRQSELLGETIGFFAKQIFVLQIRLIGQISLIRQNNNCHTRENANGVEMAIPQVVRYAN